MSDKKQPPEVIYLQWHGADKSELTLDELASAPESGDVTWCIDKINDTDIRYVIDRRHVRKERGK